MSHLQTNDAEIDAMFTAMFSDTPLSASQQRNGHKATSSTVHSIKKSTSNRSDILSLGKKTQEDVNTYKQKQEDTKEGRLSNTVIRQQLNKNERDAKRNRRDDELEVAALLQAMAMKRKNRRDDSDSDSDTGFSGGGRVAMLKKQAESKAAQQAQRQAVQSQVQDAQEAKKQAKKNKKKNKKARLNDSTSSV